ncbi:hypothetical protein E6C27_scaffold128G003470 [Cucumis melo var. makuwa]|uniref:Uncharacterized protein n=1 Tax=Cucumis melo var. makuwa TaxID=1194695 RepID=A0A5A7TEH0_CUCMM|nr:hypothetical protein E6C27_scaffold128G003470 [Cucumis melo var. makuwa]
MQSLNSTRRASSRISYLEICSTSPNRKVTLSQQRRPTGEKNQSRLAAQGHAKRLGGSARKQKNGSDRRLARAGRLGRRGVHAARLLSKRWRGSRSAHGEGRWSGRLHAKKKIRACGSGSGSKARRGCSSRVRRSTVVTGRRTFRSGLLD